VANALPRSHGSSFGALLREWRVKQRLSLRDLATRVYVDYGHLGKVERGTRIASRELVEACESVLDAGGELRAAWRADDAVAGYRPAQLPAAGRLFVGRETEREQVRTVLTADPNDAPALVVVAGAPGVGKTSLALHCANDVADRFADGVLFADLSGYADKAGEHPADVLEQFLLALGVPPASVPRDLAARASLYRTVLYGRKALIVLDNVRGSEQVLPLLPSGKGSAVLVTSRNRMSGLTVRHGAIGVRLPPLPEAHAVDVLRSILGAERVAAEPDAARTLARQCSGLPLALCVAAERIAARPQRRLADLVDDLANETDQLDVLTVADDVSLEVRRVFSWSYRALPEDAAHVFRVLSLHWSAEFSIFSAASVVGYPPRRVRLHLDTLTGAHLIDEVDRDHYRFHDLLRTYAGELARAVEPPDQLDAARDRLLRWYLATVHAANRMLAPYRRRPDLSTPVDDLVLPAIRDWPDAVAWCERELPALTVATARAVDSTVPTVAHELPVALWDFFFLRKPWNAWLAMNENGLEVARRTHDRAAEAHTEYNLGVAYLDLGETDKASRSLERSLDLRRRLGDRAGQGWSLVVLGNNELSRGAFDVAAKLHEEALDIFREIDDEWAVGITRGYLGGTYTLCKRFAEADPELVASQRILHELGDRQGEGCALDLIARLHIGQEHWAEATDYLNRAIELRATIGDRRGEAGTLLTLGRVQLDRGQRTDAERSLRRALALFTELGDPEASTVREQLDNLDVG
jgi:tetratricopeptide (TPR) repeat protein/transcriptional regulator with XRE-family HTH domain